MKNRKPVTAIKQGRKILFICLFISALLVSVVLVLALVKRTKGDQDAEGVILGKLDQKPIMSKFSPVAIYRVENGKAFFAGSGSLFRGSEGEQIVTSEHLFRKELGSPVFAYRTLRPLEADITHSVNKILHKGEDLAFRPGGLPDVVIIKTGDALPIECYSDRTLLHDNANGQVTKSPAITVRSLVSGESVRIVGTVTSSRDAGTPYAILECVSISGESGTGFIDELDHLYVLKGVLEWLGKSKIPIQKLLGTDKELSIAYGPLQFRD